MAGCTSTMSGPRPVRWRRRTAVGLAGGPSGVVDGAQGPVGATQDGRVAGRAGRGAGRAACGAVVRPGQVAGRGVAGVVRRAAVVGLDAVARAPLVAAATAYIRARLRNIAGVGLGGRSEHCSIPAHQVFMVDAHCPVRRPRSSLTRQKVCEMGCVACHLFGALRVTNRSRNPPLNLTLTLFLIP